MKVEKGLTVKKLVEILRAFPQDLEVEIEIEIETGFIQRNITEVISGIVAKHSPEQAILERETVFLVHHIDWE